MNTEQQKTDEQCFSFRERLSTTYRLGVAMRWWRKPAPVPDGLTSFLGNLATIIGLLLLSPIILTLIILGYLWMPFYPAWRALWITPKAVVNVNHYLCELDKEKTESAE